MLLSSFNTPHSLKAYGCVVARGSKIKAVRQKTAIAAFRSPVLNPLPQETRGQRLQQTRNIPRETHLTRSWDLNTTTTVTSRIYETVAAGEHDDKCLDLRHCSYMNFASQDFLSSLACWLPLRRVHENRTVMANHTDGEGHSPCGYRSMPPGRHLYCTHCKEGITPDKRLYSCAVCHRPYHPACYGLTLPGKPIDSP